MSCEKFVASDIVELLHSLKEVMLANKAKLIELDGVMGDGDLGLTMASAFSAAASAAAALRQEADIGKIFTKAGMEMAKAAPSTMGTLMGTGFMRGGKALKEKTEMGLVEMSLFWRAFVEGLKERGKAKAGDKTIIDSLEPAACAFEKAAGENKYLQEGLFLAREAAEAGMENTKTMTAQFGRMAYNQEKSKTLIDGGAVVGFLLIKTFAEITGEEKQ